MIVDSEYLEMECPHCGSGEIEMKINDIFFTGSELHTFWECTCSEGHEFVSAEISRVTHSFVAKDFVELDMMMDKELGE